MRVMSRLLILVHCLFVVCCQTASGYGLALDFSEVDILLNSLNFEKEEISLQDTDDSIARSDLENIDSTDLDHSDRRADDRYTDEVSRYSDREYLDVDRFPNGDRYVDEDMSQDRREYFNDDRSFDSEEPPTSTSLMDGGLFFDIDLENCLNQADPVEPEEEAEQEEEESDEEIADEVLDEAIDEEDVGEEEMADEDMLAEDEEIVDEEEQDDYNISDQQNMMYPMPLQQGMQSNMPFNSMPVMNMPQNSTPLITQTIMQHDGIDQDATSYSHSTKNKRRREDDDEYIDEEYEEDDDSLRKRSGKRRKLNTSRRHGVNLGVSNRPDYEVVNETIEYLRQLKVLDEKKLSRLSFGDTGLGTCLVCGHEGVVHKLNGKPTLGFCDACLIRQENKLNSGTLKSDYESSKRHAEASTSSNEGSIQRVLFGDGHNEKRSEHQSKHSEGGVLESAIDAIAGKGSSQGGLAGIVSGLIQKSKEEDKTGITTTISAPANQLVMNASGQMVPLSSLTNTTTPYGYIKDPITGALRPASSLAEALTFANSMQGTAGMSGVATGVGMPGMPGTSTGLVATGVPGIANNQMVMNALGQMVPLSSLTNTTTPYGYVKDPITGVLRPASSLAEAIASAATNGITQIAGQNSTIGQALNTASAVANLASSVAHIAKNRSVNANPVATNGAIPVSNSSIPQQPAVNQTVPVAQTAVTPVATTPVRKKRRF